MLKLPEGKTVIVNSEAVINGKHAIPQVYQNKNKVITRINALNVQNTYCEVEGTAVRFIDRNHLQENMIVVSNDTGACILAANKRDHVNNEFSLEFWLEIVYTSNATGLIGSKDNRVSEYWNVN